MWRVTVQAAADFQAARIDPLTNIEHLTNGLNASANLKVFLSCQAPTGDAVCPLKNGHAVYTDQHAHIAGTHGVIKLSEVADSHGCFRAAIAGYCASSFVIDQRGGLQPGDAHPKFVHVVIQLCAGGMAARGGVYTGMQPHARVQARVVVCHLLPAGVDGEIPCARQLLGSALGAISQPCAKTLPCDHLLQQGTDGFRVTPGQFQSTSVFGGDQALFVTLHSKGYAAAGGNGIHTSAVEHLVDFIDKVKVAIQQHGSE